MKKIYLYLVSMLLIPACLLSAAVFDSFKSHQTTEMQQQIVKLARWAVECRLKNKSTAKLPFKVHPLLTKKTGLFVTITKNGNQRGCMGTIEPVYGSAAREIIANAQKAAFSDTRLRPLNYTEFNQIKFHISIVGPLKPVSGIGELAPDRLGLIVRYNGKSGVLLPGEAKTASWQIKECRCKAGAPQNAQVQMFVFPTVVYDEAEPNNRSSSR